MCGTVRYIAAVIFVRLLGAFCRLPTFLAETASPFDTFTQLTS